MNLRDFEYLSAVAELRHYGKAALRCGVSQPTLSMQLKKLEEYLGVQLFERTNKQVMITPTGEKILTCAKRMLQDAQEIKVISKTAQDPLALDFRLGAFPTLAPYLLPLAVPIIMKKLPKLKLMLVEEKTEQLLDKLHTGSLDAALIGLPADGEGLESITLFEDPFMLAVPLNHPLAKYKQVTPEHIKTERLLLLEDGHCLRNQALQVCGLANTSERQDFRATSLETLRQMVASGMGITLIPKLAMRKKDGIAYIRFSDPKISRTIGLTWRKSSVRIPCIQTIANLISKAFADMQKV